MVRDGFDSGAHIAEEFPDLFRTPGHAPLREVDLCVGREQVENGAATRRDAAIVETLQIFDYDLLALFVGHSFSLGWPMASLQRAAGTFIAEAPFDLSAGES